MQAIMITVQITERIIITELITFLITGRVNVLITQPIIEATC